MKERLKHSILIVTHIYILGICIKEINASVKDDLDKANEKTKELEDKIRVLRLSFEETEVRSKLFM